MATPRDIASCDIKLSFCAWNSREISPPPTVTCSYDSDELRKVNPEQYCEILSNIVPTSKHIDHFLASERFTLTRLLFKLHNQQNRFKWYQFMVKIDKALVRIESINITEYVEELKGSCVKTECLRSSSPKWRMCSCQMHQYLLVKLMSISRLCGYATALCEKTAVFLVQFLGLGHMISNNLVFCSLISRIWVLLQSLLSNAIKWYDKLYPWCSMLKATAVPWLPSGECLPESLSTWLASESLPVNLTKKSKTQKLLSKWFTEQEESNTSAAGLLDNTADDIKLDTSSMMDLGEPISVDLLDKDMLPDSGVSRKDHPAVYQRRTEPSKVEKHSGIEDTDTLKQVGITALEADNRRKKKKKKKRKPTNPMELNNNNTPDDNCKLASVPVDHQIESDDVSQKHVEQIRTDALRPVDKDSVNIISSPRKKRKRKHSDQGGVKDFPEAQVTPTSTKAGSSIMKKRSLAEAKEALLSSDKQHLSSFTEDQIQLSPNTVKKIENEIGKSESLTLEHDSAGNMQNVSTTVHRDESLKKTKKKKKKRKLDIDKPNQENPSPSGNIHLSPNAIHQIEAEIIRNETHSGQEFNTGDVGSETVFEKTGLNMDTDGPAKKKKKRKGKRKSDQMSSKFAEEGSKLELEKQVSNGDDETHVQRGEMEVSMLSTKKKKKKGRRKESADIGRLESLPSNESNLSDKTKHEDFETCTGLWNQPSQIDQDSAKMSSKRKKKKRKRKSGQDSADIGGLESVPSNEGYGSNIGDKTKHHDFEPSQITQDSAKMSLKKKKKKKRQSDPVLQEHLDQNPDSILPIQVHGDMQSKHYHIGDEPNIQFKDDHGGKKSKKKKRKNKPPLETMETKMSEKTTGSKSKLVCELGQIKHQSKKGKMLKSNITDIDDIFYALEF